MSLYSTSSANLWTIADTWNIQTHNSIRHVVQDVIRDICGDIRSVLDNAWMLRPMSPVTLVTCYYDEIR